MITHDARRSLSRGNNLVQSPWQASVHIWVIRAPAVPPRAGSAERPNELSAWTPTALKGAHSSAAVPAGGATWDVISRFNSLITASTADRLPCQA